MSTKARTSMKLRLWDHLPPRDVFEAVANHNPLADALLAAEIRRFVRRNPTVDQVAVYRHRVVTWLGLGGLELCVMAAEQAHRRRLRRKTTG